MTLSNLRRWGAWAVLGVLVARLLGGLFLPVYTDEIAWRFHERAWIDGFDKGLAEICGPNSMAVPPWFMWPARWWSGTVNLAFPDPFYVRISGIVCALMLVAALAALLHRATRPGDERNTLTMVLFGLLGFGVVPLLLVWSRPEQPLLLGLTLALLISAAGWRAEASAVSRAVVARRVAAITVVAVVALSYHLKGVVLAPVFALAIVLCARGRETLVLRWGVALVVAVLALAAAQYWMARFACTGDPLLAAMFERQNVASNLANTGSLGAAAGKLAKNALLNTYFILSAPMVNPMSHWLRAGVITKDQEFAWVAAAWIIWRFMLLVGLVSLAVGVVRGLRERRLDPRLPIAAALLVAATLWSATQNLKPVYDATFALVLIALGIVLALAAARPGKEALRLGLALALGLVGVSAVSAVVVTGYYAHSMAVDARDSGYVGPTGYSQSVFHFASERPKVLAAAKLCGIGVKGRPKMLLIDDVTYLPFMNSYRPQYFTGVVGDWKGQIGDDAIGYLKRIGSDGAIMSCRTMNKQLLSRSKKLGDYCCVAAPGW